MDSTKTADAFVSYSRKDKEIVQRFVSGLKSRGKEIWVDWEGIEPSAEWWKKICGAIDEARTFLFVLSPHSLDSEVCRRELSRAIESGKRLLPIVCRNINGLSVPNEISKWNYLFLREVDDFDEAMDSLIHALEVDPQYVDFHSRLSREAHLWKDQGRDTSFLLRGSKLEEVQNWALAVGDRNPKLSSLQIEFIEESLAEAEREKERAIQSRKEALEMVGHVVGDLRESLEPVGQLAILEKADAAVAEYFEGRPEKEMLPAELHIKSRALLRRGEVLLEKRENREAEDLFEQGIQISKRLLSTDPDNGDWRALLAEGFLDMGDLFMAESKLGEACEQFQAALDEARILVEQEEQKDWLQLLSASYNRLGNVYREEGRFEDAGEVYETSLDICYQLNAAYPRELKFAREVAVEKQALGNSLIDRECYGEAREYFEESLEILYGLNTAEPTHAMWLADISGALKFLGIAYLRTGQFHTGRKTFQRSLDIIEDLIKRDDSNTDWKAILADRYQALGDTLSEPVGDIYSIGTQLDPSGNSYLDLDAALKAYRRRLEIFEALPGGLNQKLEVAESHRLIGVIFQKMGQRVRAQQSFQRGLDLIGLILDRKIDDWRAVYAALIGNANQGHLAFVQDGAGEALRWYRQSITYAQKLLEIDPEKPAWRVELAACHQNLGTAFQQLNDLNSSRIEFAEALSVMSDLLEKEPSKPNWINQVSSIRVQAGSLEIEARERSAARTHFDRAVTLYKELVEREPEKLEWRRLAMVALDQVGTAYKQHGMIVEAGEFPEKAVELIEESLPTWPGDSRLPLDLSSACQKLADARMLENRPRDAEIAISRSAKILEDACLKDPDNQRFKYFLGVAQIRFGDIVRLRDPDEAERHFSKGREILVALAGGGNRELYLHDALRALQQFSDHLAQTGEITRARELLEESTELLGGGIPGNESEQEKFQHLQASNYVRIGDLLIAEQKREEALESYLKGLYGLRQLVDSGSPIQLTWQIDLVGTDLRIGDVQFEEGRIDESAAFYSEGIDIISDLLSQDLSDLRIRDLKSSLESRQASIRQARGDLEAAKEMFEEAGNILTQLISEVGKGKRPDWEKRLTEITARVESLTESEA